MALLVRNPPGWKVAQRRRETPEAVPWEGGASRAWFLRGPHPHFSLPKPFVVLLTAVPAEAWSRQLGFKCQPPPYCAGDLAQGTLSGPHLSPETGNGRDAHLRDWLWVRQLNVYSQEGPAAGEL